MLKAFHTQICVSASLPFCYLQHDKAVFQKCRGEKKKPCCSDWTEVKGQAQSPINQSGAEHLCRVPGQGYAAMEPGRKKNRLRPCDTVLDSRLFITADPVAARQTDPHPPTPPPPHPPPTNKTALCRRAASIQRAGTCGRTPQKTG